MSVAKDIVFQVESSPESGGYVARWNAANGGGGITTQGDSFEELDAMVSDAVNGYFDPDQRPKRIRLHFAVDLVIIGRVKLSRDVDGRRKQKLFYFAQKRAINSFASYSLGTKHMTLIPRAPLLVVLARIIPVGGLVWGIFIYSHAGDIFSRGAISFLVALPGACLCTIAVTYVRAVWAFRTLLAFYIVIPLWSWALTDVFVLHGGEGWWDFMTSLLFQMSPPIIFVVMLTNSKKVRAFFMDTEGLKPPKDCIAGIKRSDG